MAKKIVFNLETNTDLDGVDKQINTIISSTKTLKQQYRELRDAAAEATDPAEFDRLAKEAGRLKDRIDDTNRSVRAFASDTRGLDIVVGSVRGVAGAFAAVQGSIALLAGENENLNKVLVKVQGSLAVLNGIQQVSQTLNKNSTVGLALYRAQQTLLNSSILGGARAISTFNAALIATGIGAFVVGLGLLIANFDKVTQAIGLSKSELEKFNEEAEKAAEVLNSKLTKIVIETEREFTNLKEEIALTIDPLEKLEKLIKRFPEFAAIDPKDPELADKINEKLSRRETILRLTKEEGAIINEQNERLIKITELGLEQDKAIREGDKEKIKLISLQIANLLRRNAADTENISQKKSQRVELESNIRTEIAGIDQTTKAQSDAERKRLEAIRNREQAARIDEQNRIALIENRIQRELALISQKYNTERAEARKIGADITLINQKEERDRANFIQNQQRALGEVILRAFRGVSEDLKKLSLSTYEDDLKEFRKAQDQKRAKLIEDLIEVQDNYISLARVSGAASDEFFEDLVERNKNLKETFVALKDQISTVKGELIEAEQTLLNIGRIESRQEDLIRLNAITDGLKFVINLEEKISDINVIAGREALQRLKAETGFSEGISDLKIRLTKREAETRLLEEQKVLEGISVAGDKEIFERLKRNDIATDQLTEKQERYVKRITLINESFADDELRRLEALLNLEKEFINEGLDFRRNYFQRLNELKQQSIESETRINDNFIEKEKLNRDAALELEKNFLLKKQELLSADFKTEEERQKELLKVENLYRLQSLNAQIKLKRDKLAILEEEKRVNPNINPQLFAEIQNEILQLQNSAQETQIALAEQQNTDLTAILRQFGQELAFQTDGILSGIASIYSTAQSENQRLLQEGKITAEENERRQKELFEQQKKIEISRTVISTLSSAQGAYQSQFVPVPDPSSPIRGALFAGAALVAGFARVKAIQSQNYSGQAVSPPTPVNTSSFLRDPGTSQIIEPQQNPNIVPSLRVFVTENDITETQRRVRVIQNGSRTTF